MEQGMSRSEKRRRFKKIGNSICLGLLTVVSLAVFLYSGYHLWDYYADHRSEVALEEELMQLRGEVATERVVTGAGASPEGTDVTSAVEAKTIEQLRSFYHKMKQKNEDYVCWVTLTGAGIDYPVVKRDNAFYLDHDIEGNKNRHGSIFMDETCEPTDDVLLLHGHHMKDGTMFGGLKHFKDSEFCEENREVILEFEEVYTRYRIFAVAQVDLAVEGSFAFEVLPQTEEELTLYIEGLDRASFWYDETVVGESVKNDAFLVLSTCDYVTDDQRLLVAAKKIE